MISPLKNRQQIIGLIGRADDNKETLDIINNLNALKRSRPSFYLNQDELEIILKWKLRGQYGRQKELRSLNTNELIQSVTKLAFGIQHGDKVYETELKIKILTVLKGVEVPVASAILTLCYPEKYGVIDFRNWRLVFGTKKNVFTFKDYQKYLKVIQRLANDFSFTPQEIDMALWQLDIESNLPGA